MQKASALLLVAMGTLVAARPERLPGTLSQITLTSSTTVDFAYDVYFIDASGGSITVTLHDVSQDDGVVAYFKRLDTNALATVAIAAHSGQAIDGFTSRVLAVRASIQICPYGTASHILSSHLVTSAPKPVHWNSSEVDDHPHRLPGTLSQTTITGSTTVDFTFDVYFIDATGGSLTVTLHDVSSDDGVVGYFKRIDTNLMATVTIAAHSGQTIDGQSTRTLGSLACIKLNPYSGDSYVLSSHLIAS